jgi:cell division septation protein DedD
MAENRRGKENRFYFSRGQMVLLGAGFTLASVIIFVLGIFVGKGIEARKMLKPEEPLVKIPVKPGTQQSSGASAPAQKDEITFNDALSKSAGSAVAAEEKPEAAKRAERVARAGPRESPPAPKPERKIEKAAPAAEPAKKTESAANDDSEEQGRSWRAQVNAFPDERSAKLIVDRLKNKGYNAYVSEVQNRGKTWYRVNVGKFGTRDEADKMAELLRARENFPKAFAASR